MAGPLKLPRRVIIREVGPRDGLQSEKPLSVRDRARLIDALSATGVPKIEAVSFVSPKAVPAMADAAEVWKRVRRAEGVAYSALVPNRRGAEAAGPHEGRNHPGPAPDQIVLQGRSILGERKPTA